MNSKTIDRVDRETSDASTVDAIKDNLTCGICHDIVNLPVLPACCETGQPACLTCVRAYYTLNEPPRSRSYERRMSWTGCGHNVLLTEAGKRNVYKDASALYCIRDHLGSADCPNKCGAVFTTQASLRRHLRGEARDSEPPNCPESRTKCELCGMYGTRRDLKTAHFEKCHSVIKCKFTDVTINTTAGTYKEDLRHGLAAIVDDFCDARERELELMKQLEAIRVGGRARAKAAAWALKLAGKSSVHLDRWPRLSGLGLEQLASP